MRNKLKISLAVFLVLGISVFLFLVPRLSKVDKTWELSMRKAELRYWAKRIAEYESDTGKLPNSLYEASWYKNAGPTRMKIMTGNFIPDMLNMRDPNLFFKEVEYSLIKGINSWYIIELEGGKFCKYRFMINQNKKIYELREVQP